MVNTNHRTTSLIGSSMIFWVALSFSFSVSLPLSFFSAESQDITICFPSYAIFPCIFIHFDHFFFGVRTLCFYEFLLHFSHSLPSTRAHSSVIHLHTTSFFTHHMVSTYTNCMKLLVDLC